MRKSSRTQWMVPDDLAPGDSKSLLPDWSGFELEVIESTGSPFFMAAFDALWAEFGEAGEMEQPDVLAKRMAWDPSVFVDGHAMHYQMMLVHSGGKIAGVTDQTAILTAGEPGVIVHHSHILLAPEWRRTGLAGWLRALPLTTARQLLRVHNQPATSTVTIVGEMEHPDPADPATHGRLTAMEKAGYKKADPARVRYLQPDFRAHHEIDKNGPQPIPLALVLRRVGREEENSISGAEIRRFTSALYKMYGRGMRAADMAAVHASLADYPGCDERIRLVPPTA